MKQSLTVRLQPESIDAAKSCAVREHRSLTDFMEASLMARIGDVTSRDVKPRQPSPSQQEGQTHGE